MAAKTDNIIKTIVELAYKIIGPVAKLLSNDAQRKEFEESLGLVPGQTQRPDNLPSGSSIEAYYKSQSDEKEALLLVAAVAELAEMVDVLENYFRACFEDDQEQEASLLFTALLNASTLNYVARKYPKLHNILMLIRPIDELAGRVGGMGYAWDYIYDYANSFLTEYRDVITDEKIVGRHMDVAYLALTVFSEFVLSGSKIRMFVAKGYEPNPRTRIPFADRASDTALSLGLTIPTSKGEQAIYFTYVPVPESRGGDYIILAGGTADAKFSFGEDDKWKFEVKASGEAGVSQTYGTGGKFFATENQSLRLSLKHETGEINKRNLLTEKAKVAIGWGNFKIAGLAQSTSQDKDFALELSFDVAFEIDKGTKPGFPFNLLPKTNTTKTIPLVLSTKRGIILAGQKLTKKETKKEGAGERSLRSRALVAPKMEFTGNSLLLIFGLDKSLPGVSIQNFNLGLGLANGSLVVEASLDATLRLGPVQIAFSRLGVLATGYRREDNGGVLGHDFDISLKLPSGAGVVVDAKFVKGGGFLYLDRARGEYYGAIELEIFEEVALSAVGIIQRQMPDGSEGFSMLLIVSTEFMPWQLGFGFTLEGVGGVLGLHREVNFPLLVGQLRRGEASRILFPPDPVANLPRIVSDLKEIFPGKKNRFLIGLAGRFGWGSSDLVRIDLGLIVEFNVAKNTPADPDVVLIGTVRCMLPHPDLALVKIIANIAGKLSVREKYLFFRADLSEESELLGFQLQGSLVMFVGWGNPGGFAFSLGGFHQYFTQMPTVPGLPGAFSGLQRVKVSVLGDEEDSVATITVDFYLAITSNSFQIGGQALLDVDGPWSFNLHGFIKVDALIYFDPFSFDFQLDAGIAFRHGTDVLMNVALGGRLTGPRPWHVSGYASFDPGWWCPEIKIPFSYGWGSEEAITLRETENLTNILKKEIADDRNWRMEIDRFTHHHITLRNATNDSAEKDLDENDRVLLVNPAGVLLFVQRTLPLERRLDRFGNKRPRGTADYFQFKEINTISSPDSLGFETETERFAPGQFFELTESERLSRPDMETMTGGFRLHTAGKLTSAKPLTKPRSFAYERVIIPAPEQKPSDVTLPKATFDGLLNYASVSKSRLGAETRKRPSMAPISTQLKVPGFTLANTIDMTRFKDDTTPGGFNAKNHTEANQILQNLLRRRPDLIGQLQVVQEYEID